MCEEFNVLPSQAVEELENESNSMVTTIIHMRAFVQTKTQYDGAKKKTDVPYTPMLELLQEIEFAEAKREIAERE